MSYRAWLYHRTEPPRLCTSQAQVDWLLAQGWADTPTAFQVKASDSLPRRRGRPRKDTT